MEFSTITSEIIPSGSIFVDKSSEKILKAFLGTCVGVALYDPKNKIGGLFHILLPEPTGHETVDPLNYASTGLPLFLDEIYKKGGQKEELKAIIAGGALVGTITMQDLNLDIGGNTTDVVSSILADEGIQVEHSETGGYFSCVLNFNLSTWEYQIEPIGQRPLNIEAKPSSSSETIEQAIAKVRPIPQIALKVIRMIHSNKFDMDSIAKEIRQDQVLGAKIINLSNSAYMSPNRKVETIDQGLVLLGEKRILLLTLSVFTELYFQNAEQGYSLSRGGLYHHSLGTAILADHLATITGKAMPGLAYTAGLLHDIGKTVLDQYVADDYPLFYRSFHGSEKSITEVENEVFGLTHTDVGTKLAIQWQLPESLLEVITYHHTPEDAINYPELTNLVYFADVLMSKFRVAYELERIDTEKLASRMGVINLDINNLQKIIEQIPWKDLDSGSAVFSST